MTALLNLIETGLVTALSGNANLTALVGNQIYDSQAAAGVTGDYCIFQYVAGGDENVNARRSVDASYRVEMISTTHANAELGAGYIDDALNGKQLTIAGWTTWGLTLGRLFNMVEDILGVPYYRKGGIYRIRIDNE
jgi:hypothetical protein